MQFLNSIPYIPLLLPLTLSINLLPSLLLPSLPLLHPINTNTTITTTINKINPHCYTPASLLGVQPTNPSDCRAALEVLIRQPDFTTRYQFSKNPRRGIKLPRGWMSGECLIFVTCENDRDMYEFRFADVARVARKVIGNCVGKPNPLWGTLNWGGVDDLGDSETFYVSVGRPVPPGGGGGGGGGVGNVTALTRNGSIVEVDVE